MQHRGLRDLHGQQPDHHGSLIAHRYSTLNATNDYQVFAETFEAACFVGVESYRISMDLCPDGTASGLADVDPCSTGS